MKESKEKKKYRKFHTCTPRKKFKNALFILTLYSYNRIKIDKVWSNRKTIYRCLWEVGCEWHTEKVNWGIGRWGRWVLSNCYDKNLRDKWLNNEHY